MFLRLGLWSTHSPWNLSTKKNVVSKLVHSSSTISPFAAISSEKQNQQSKLNYGFFANARHITNILHNVDKDSIPLNSYIYARLLQECIDTKSVAQGKSIHAQMLQSGFRPDLYLTTKLVVMYAKFGILRDARQVFDKMPERNPVSWNALITGCAQHGQGDRALFYFNEMRRARIEQGQYAFASVLKACSGLQSLQQGKQVHQCMIKAGLEYNVFVCSALIDMYVKCARIEDACNVFDKMRQRDVVLWTTIIAGLAQNGVGEKSLELFKQMLSSLVKPNEFTFAGVVMACSSLTALEQGKQIHGCLLKSGFIANVVLANVLIDMYCRCGTVEDACQVFDEMPQRNKVSWNALVAGKAQHGYSKEALELFWKMQNANMNADEFTFASILVACASLADQRLGRWFHASIIKNGLESNDVLGSALIDMYAKCGSMEDARVIFNEISGQNLVSGNTMITAYAQHGQGEKALEVFDQMQRAGMKSDMFTFASLLQACAGAASPDLGKQIHSYIIRHGFESYTVFQNSLIDMYAKSGILEDARQVFEEMPERNVVSWTAIIVGYGKHGLGKEAIQFFKKMQMTGMKLDHVTFLAVLFACSHAGLVNEGWHYFHSMSKEYGISPRVEHYGCMIDLLGRAGLLDEAYNFILKMPVAPSAAMWGALLGACINCVNTKLGKIVAEHLFELDSQNSANYVALSNIYAAAGKWKEVAEVRKVMKERGIVKEPGCSWIVVNKELHEFRIRDTSHPKMAEIFAAWANLAAEMKEAGYVPDTSCVLHDVEEEHKKDILYYHSEKLAITFGLIRIPDRMPIRIVKNLRVCSDCHTATKFISQIVAREIVVRDGSRFHHFKNGLCSCGDYW